MTITDLFGWTGTVAAIVSGMPQLVHLIRTRSVEGLSFRAWQSILAINIAWTSHGLIIGQAPQVVASVLAACSTIPIIVLMSRHRGAGLVAGLLPGAAVGVIMVGIDLALGSAAFGIIATAVGVVSTIGQSVALVRSPHVRGVSIGFLIVGVVNQGSWTVWAFLVDDPGTMIAATTCCVIAVFNLVWYVVRRLGVRAFWPLDEPEPVLAAEPVEI